MDWTDRTLYPNSGSNGACRKCGYQASLPNFIKARYCSGAVKWLRGFWSVWFEHACEFKVEGEHLHRRCIICDAEWVETCVYKQGAKL